MADNSDPNPLNQPRNLKEGVVKSLTSLATGVAGVIVAPIATPFNAVKEDGMQGLAAGIAQGLAEGVGSAMAGVAGFVAHPILALSCPADSTSIPVFSCIMDRQQVRCARCDQPFALSPLYQGPKQNRECRQCRGLDPHEVEHLGPPSVISEDQGGERPPEWSFDQLEVAGFDLAKRVTLAGGKFTTGVSVRHFQFAGFDSWKLYLSGCSAKQLKSAGFDLEELKDAGFDLEQLKDAGFNARQLRFAGFDVGQLKDAGFNFRQLKDAGFDARQLEDAGFHFRRLDDA